MSWLYILENKNGPSYTDTAYPFLMSIGSNFYFGDSEYQVLEYLMMDEAIKEDYDADFCVYCTELETDFKYKNTLRSVKLQALGL